MIKKQYGIHKIAALRQTLFVYDYSSTRHIDRLGAAARSTPQAAARSTPRAAARSTQLEVAVDLVG